MRPTASQAADDGVPLTTTILDRTNKFITAVFKRGIPSAPISGGRFSY